jgi:predicted PurR-regulated permease PerM
VSTRVPRFTDFFEDYQVRKSIAETGGVGNGTTGRAVLKVPQVEEKALVKRREINLLRSREAPRFAMLFIAAVLVGIVLYQASAVMVPVMAAIIIGSTIGPYADYAERYGIPHFLIYLVMTLLVALIPYLLFISLSTPVSTWIARAPEVGALLEGRLKFLERPMSAWREVRETIQGLGGNSGANIEVATTTSVDTLVTGAMSFVTPAIGQFLVFFGSLVFFLSGRRQLKQRLTLSFPDRKSRLRTLKAIADIEASLTTYLTSMTLINLVVGTATGVAVFLLGIENPFMWGLTAFICNYIPYVGPLILALVFALVGLLTFENTLHAMLVPTIYLMIVFIETHFATPAVMSRRLEMNTFLVFVGVVFWSWMWGLAGAFLAMPLLIVGNAVLRQLRPPAEKDVLP